MQTWCLRGAGVSACELLRFTVRTIPTAEKRRSTDADDAGQPTGIIYYTLLCRADVCVGSTVREMFCGFDFRVSSSARAKLLMFTDHGPASAIVCLQSLLL